jgi:hypothetical protein
MSGTKVLGLAAVGAFLVMAVPVGTAQAMSLINPGAAATVRENAKLPAIEVRWHWHHHGHHGWHHRWHRHWHWHHRGHWHRWHHHRHW